MVIVTKPVHKISISLRRNKERVYTRTGIMSEAEMEIWRLGGLSWNAVRVGECFRVMRD